MTEAVHRPRRTGGWVAMLALLVALVATPAAQAAFPGRDGVLALRPVSGPGVVIADARGGHVRHICARACGTAGLPRFAPDGRSLIAPSRYGLKQLGLDGSCLDCRFSALKDAAFLPNGTELSGVGYEGLVLDGIDSLERGVLLAHPVEDAVWSSGGRVAVATHGRVAIGRTPAGVRDVARGGGPLSWSPAGRTLAFVAHGWVVVFDGRRVTRLVRGSGPAFSPDGRSLAYLAAGHRVRIVVLATGHSRPVSHLRALGVDWQPRPGHTRSCALPPGTTIAAADSEAIVTSATTGMPAPSSFGAYMGCLRSDGRPRLLLEQPTRFGEDSLTAQTFAAGGPFVAFYDFYGSHYPGQSGGLVEEFDVRTGALVSALPPFGCSSSYPSPSQPAPCSESVNQLAFAPDGAYAYHEPGDGCRVGGQPELIVAEDASGPHALDQAPPAACGAPDVLTALAVNGQTAKWDHAGSPRSATLG